MNELPEEQSPQVRTMWLLWVSFAMAPIALFAIALLIAPFSLGEFYFLGGLSARPPMIGWVFLGISALSLVMAPVLRSLVLRSGAAAATAMSPDQPPAPAQPLGVVFSAWIIAMAITEAGVLLGFVLMITTQNAANGIPFYLIYVLLLVQSLPTRSRRAAWSAAAGSPAGLVG
ncbi:MAG: hypothetical protein CVT67_05460 [Actinobacteria bacterium HGW-Actinobacteria-7]|nr:MAG: hypothetical protein CVT67_05460 [Actinobacteria bacterium HGW-Actinobacteria-7]